MRLRSSPTSPRYRVSTDEVPFAKPQISKTNSQSERLWTEMNIVNVQLQKILFFYFAKFTYRSNVTYRDSVSRRVWRIPFSSISRIFHVHFPIIQYENYKYVRIRSGLRISCPKGPSAFILTKFTFKIPRSVFWLNSNLGTTALGADKYGGDFSRAKQSIRCETLFYSDDFYSDFRFCCGPETFLAFDRTATPIDCATFSSNK